MSSRPPNHRLGDKGRDGDGRGPRLTRIRRSRSGLRGKERRRGDGSAPPVAGAGRKESGMKPQPWPAIRGNPDTHGSAPGSGSGARGGGYCLCAPNAPATSPLVKWASKVPVTAEGMTWSSVAPEPSPPEERACPLALSHAAGGLGRARRGAADNANVIEFGPLQRDLPVRVDRVTSIPEVGNGAHDGVLGNWRDSVFLSELCRQHRRGGETAIGGRFQHPIRILHLLRVGGRDAMPLYSALPTSWRRATPGTDALAKTPYSRGLD